VDTPTNRIEIEDIVLDYADIEEARRMSGLRLILGAYTIPGPWRESGKGLFYVKGLAYTPVRTANRDRSEDEFGFDSAASVLEKWTGQASAPVAVWNDERPCSSWIDQIYLADRLNPDPPLLPENLNDRARMIGLIHLICGQQGLGWNCRHLIVKGALAELTPDNPWYARLKFIGEKYSYSTAVGDTAPQRIAEILNVLNAQLESQHQAGSKYFFGNRLSALDIFWACFTGVMLPLPEDQCPMATDYRPSYTATAPAIVQALTPQLVTHRDYIYKNYLELPIVF
jgi:glutathione S-transferase